MELLCESRSSCKEWVWVCDSMVLWALYVLNSHITATVAGSDWSGSKTVRREGKSKSWKAVTLWWIDVVFVCAHVLSVLDGDVEEHYTAAILLGPFHAEGHSCGVTWNMVQSALHDQSLPPLSSFCVVWRPRRFGALTFFAFWSDGKSVPVETCPRLISSRPILPSLPSLFFFPIGTSQSQSHRWEQRLKCYVIMSVLVLFFSM